MEWLINYWYIVLIGLFVLTVYVFGHKTGGQHSKSKGSCCGGDAAQKEKKDSHSCCH